MSTGRPAAIPWCRRRRTAAASSASSVVTAPPSPVVTILRGWNERQASSPSAPHGVPRYRAPSAPAASSTSATSCGTAVCSSSQSTGRPKRCTASTARVRGVTASATSSGRTLNVSGSTSTSTARAPAQLDGVRGRGEGVRGDDHLVALADPEREHGEVQRRRAGRDRDRVRRADRARRSRASKASTCGPIVSWPLASTSATAASSASPTSGRASRTWGSLTPARAEPGAVPRDRALEPLVELDAVPRSRGACAPSRCSGSAARRRCTRAARSGSRPGQPVRRLIRVARS